MTLPTTFPEPLSPGDKVIISAMKQRPDAWHRPPYIARIESTEKGKMFVHGMTFNARTGIGPKDGFWAWHAEPCTPENRRRYGLG